MTVRIIKTVSKGQKNTRWQFADACGSIFDGLLPTSGSYYVGQEIDKDAFSSIRTVGSGQPASVSAPATHTYVNVLTGEVVAQNMTEAEFEAMIEFEF